MLQAWILSVRLFSVLFILAILTSISSPAHAVVLHPGSDSTAYLPKPDSSIVGSTSSGGGCGVIAIAPNFALTARHVGVNAGSGVYFAGKRYVVSQVHTFGTADLRLLKLKNSSGGDARLSKFAPLYTRSDEYGKQIVLGGYGKGRGSTLYNNGKAYGYGWGSSAKRFGANKIDGQRTLSAGGYTSQVLSIDFDAPGSYSAVKYEAANAVIDSGSGWFVKDDGVWKTIAIANAVERGGSSWYKNSWGYTDPDRNYGIRMSYYANSIKSKMGSTAYNQMVYSSGTISSIGSTIPEPASAALLASAAGVLLVRRRR